VVLAALLGLGCGAARSMGRSAADGALDALEQRGGTSALARGAVSGARDELTSEESRRKLEATQHELMESLTTDAARLRDQMVGAPLRADMEALRAEVLGRTRRELLEFRDDLLGQATEARTRRLMEAVVGEETRLKLGLLRDDLMGTATQAYVRDIVRTAAATAVEEYKGSMQAPLEAQKRDIERRARRLIWTLGAALGGVVALAGFLFRRSRRVASMLDVVTTQIHGIPLRAAYDELTARISQKAKEAGVEGDLRERLKKNSLLGRENWRTPAPPAPSLEAAS
jgi:hypothetical protein